MTHLRILRPATASGPDAGSFHALRYATGTATFSSAGAAITGGAPAPDSEVAFSIPAGAADVGDVVHVIGANSYWTVTGVTRLPPFFSKQETVAARRDSVADRVLSGETYPAGAEGFTLVADGYTMVSR